MTQAEILSIGNEVLNGDVVDTNSNWLARQVARRGGRVRRVTT
ncbi:MAG: competence/damage-inducible protein A, partial [Anaerolineae bacterium]|nr:competence/damage-inducible protein A [Anaerolineae bacterium]